LTIRSEVLFPLSKYSRSSHGGARSTLAVVVEPPQRERGPRWPPFRLPSNFVSAWPRAAGSLAQGGLSSRQRLQNRSTYGHFIFVILGPRPSARSRYSRDLESHARPRTRGWTSSGWTFSSLWMTGDACIHECTWRDWGVSDHWRIPGLRDRHRARRRWEHRWEFKNLGCKPLFKLGVLLLPPSTVTGKDGGPHRRASERNLRGMACPTG
jgi:hypothetical protein